MAGYSRLPKFVGFLRVQPTQHLVNDPEVNVDTNRIALDLWPPHPPAHVRVYRENKCFDENAAIQGNVVEVDRLRLIVDDGLPRDGII